MSDEQQGFDARVCASCLEDEGLRQFAAGRGRNGQCDYCETKSTPDVVAFDDVVAFMREAITQEWDNPVNNAPHDASEGGYQIDTFDSEELFHHICFDLSNEALLRDLLDAFDNHRWCERNWELLSPSKRWVCGWERFQHVVKHERRYTFWTAEKDIEDVSHPDSLPPSDVLSEIGSALAEMVLVKPLGSGTEIWRAQLHPSAETLLVPDRFASPPIEFATKPNRMSPAGVPMFYGSDDFETACLELTGLGEADLKSKSISGARFRAVTTMNLLDLTIIPSPPSYFTTKGPSRRHIISFLKKFAADVSQPIKRDGRQHIEYVPTQVFTEFVRHLMKNADGSPIHGIRYSSSRNGRVSYVIFATQAECLPPHGPLDFTKQVLEFVPGSIKVVSADLSP